MQIGSSSRISAARRATPTPHDLSRNPSITTSSSLRQLASFGIKEPIARGSHGSKLVLPANTRRSQVSSLPHNGQYGVGVQPVDEVPLQAAATLRTASFLGFWVQLPLTLVSAVVLFFSLAFANTRMSAPDPTKYFTLAGIVFAFISTFFAASFRRTARALLDGQPVRRSAIVSNILRNNTINFLGIGVTLVGLQAAVGGLVAKTLLAAPNPYQAGQSASAVVSLDVFSLQASTNTILAHFLSLIFSSIMLRAINRTQAAPASY